MTKNDLLKQIAESAYNIGFGAKKSFATFDIVDKIPGILNFCALAIGILALVIDELNIKIVSASLIIFGVIGIYISKYDDKKDEYATSGSKITEMFNELKSLYHLVKAKSDDTNFDEDEDIEIIVLSLRETKEMIYSKEIDDAKTILGIMMYSDYIEKD